MDRRGFAATKSTHWVICASAFGLWSHGAQANPEVIRMDKEQGIARHRELVAEGWRRRFTADEPRLSEMKNLYSSLGLEVRVETDIPDEDADCSSCFDAEGFSDKYKTIYTRGEERAGRESEDLFD